MRLAAAALMGLLAVPTFCFPQDEPEARPEELDLEVVPVERPASADLQQDRSFKLKEPLTLEGLAAKNDALRDAVAKGMKYLLEQQQEDGTWKFIPKEQVRPEVPKNQQYFVPTASQTLNRVVTTALACMALRAHQELAPDRIDAAVAKALPYVLENAPKHQARQYAVWTWSLSIEFLIGEHARAKADDQKEKILASIKGTVQKLIEGQHPGSSKAAAVLPPAVEKKEEGPKKRKGFFGVTPTASPEGEDLPGILISGVQRNGPASKAGLKAGDRILEINGVRIQGLEHLYEAVADLPVGEPAKVKVLRGAPKQATPAARNANLRDGGWGYYSWMEAATNCTATALLALGRAQEIGIEIPEEVFDRGLGFLATTRMIREGTDEVGYRYTMRDAGDGLDVRATVARVTPCSYALYKGGLLDVTEVERSAEIFARRRGELDKVLGYPGNHVPNSFYNSAYYFMWSHYYTSRALEAVRDTRRRREIGTTIQEALLKLQHEDGTWTDHEAWGRLYGTSMCLVALGELKFLAPEAYTKPAETLKPAAPKEEHE